MKGDCRRRAPRCGVVSARCRCARRNLLSRAISIWFGAHDSTFCLWFIDPWGDTTSNQLQIPHLIIELRVVRESVDVGTRELVDAPSAWASGAARRSLPMRRDRAVSLPRSLGS